MDGILREGSSDLLNRLTMKNFRDLKDFVRIFFLNLTATQELKMDKILREDLLNKIS